MNTTPFEQLEIMRDASLSTCGLYRWSLTRVWDDDLHKPWLGWIMLNPSTADADVDDPTIRRCMRFAHAWGYAGIVVMNLFNLRATDPADLAAAAAPIAPLPDHLQLCAELFENLFELCPMVVAAWGAHDIVKAQGATIGLRAACIMHTRELHCLGTTADGSPRHPLYVRGDAKPRVWFDGQKKEAK